jgi:hypothetical protein
VVYIGRKRRKKLLFAHDHLDGRNIVLYCVIQALCNPCWVWNTLRHKIRFII